MTVATEQPAGRIIRNVLVLGVGQIFTWVSAAGMAVLLPRYLGDVNLGRLSLAFSFTQLFGMVASLGISTYLVREVARGGKGASPLVLNAMIMRLPLSIAAAIGAAASATLFGYDELTTQLIYLYCVSIALGAVTSVLAGSLQGLQDMRPVAVSNTISKASLLGFAALFLILGYGPIGVAVAWNLSGAIGLLLLLFPLLRRGGLQGRVAPGTWRTLFVGGMPFMVWEVSLLLYGQIDVVLLSSFTHDAVVGWYGAAYRVISIPGFLPGIVMTVLLPALLSASRTDRRQFEILARRSLHVVLLCSIPVAMGILVLPDRIINFLGYPAEFLASIPLMMILALHVPLTGADMILGTALNALDKQRQWSMTAVAAAVLNPTINVAMIPFTQTMFGNGAIGAAIVTVATELFMMSVGLYLLRGSGVLDRSCLTSALKCVLAGALMAGVVWIVRDLPIPVTVTIGGIAYGVASLGLGTLSVHDIRIVHMHLVNRVRARSVAVAEGTAS